MDVARFVNLVCAGVVAGSMLTELVVLIPALRSTSGAAFAEVNRAIAPRASRLTPIPGAVTTFAGLIAVFQHDFADTATILTIAGLAVWVAAVLTTYLAYLPVVTTMSGWEDGAAVAQNAPVLRRWASAHAARTALFVAGFGLFAAAALAA
jgi:hypothetical protein